MINSLSNPSENIFGVIILIIATLTLYYIGSKKLSKPLIFFAVPLAYGAFVSLLWWSYIPIVFAILVTLFFAALTYTTKPVGSRAVYLYSVLIFLSTPYVALNLVAMIIGLVLVSAFSILFGGNVSGFREAVKQFFSGVKYTPALSFLNLVNASVVAKNSRRAKIAGNVTLMMWLASYIFIFGI